MDGKLTKVVETRSILDKGSTEAQLRQYFSNLLVLYKSGETYPVDLDDVWMRLYSGKNKAVRALKRDFIEGEDYITMTIPGQGGHFDAVSYKLSTSCFEYFIAKKDREVFNVYRTVFKKVATGEVTVIPNRKSTQAELILMQAQQLVEQERRIMDMEGKTAALEEKVSEIALRTKTDIQYSTIIGFAKRYGIKVPLERASVLGRVAKNLCRQFQLETGIIPDPRFGSVRTYPDSVLYDTFEKYYPNIRFR